MFDPIIKYERLTPETVVMLCRHSRGTIRPMDVDQNFGAGTISESVKCVWLKSGKRVTISYNLNTLIFAQSKAPDPLYAERKADHVKTTNQGL